MKNERLNFKREIGITLIALVITIVVLLILASVTINAIMGNNGLIKKAQDTQNKMNEASQKDMNEINNISSIVKEVIENQNNNPEKLNNMYKKAIEDECQNLNGNCKREDHLHIGDYVNYIEPTSGIYNVTEERSGMIKYSTEENQNDQIYTLTETNNNVNWRVLGLDKNTGGIKLISDIPLKRDTNAALPNDFYLYMYGAEGYVYGETEFNNICKMYKDTKFAIEARSVNMEDIDDITGITTDDKKKNSDINPLYFKSKPLGNSYSYENQYTAERWIEIGKRDINNDKMMTVSGNADGYAYPVFNSKEEANKVANKFETDLQTTGYVPVIVENSRIYDMMFKNIAVTSGEISRKYWLASKSIVAQDDYARIGPGAVYDYSGATICTKYFDIYCSDTREYDYGAMIRPVVILNSSVTSKEISKIQDQQDTF